MEVEMCTGQHFANLQLVSQHFKRLRHEDKTLQAAKQAEGANRPGRTPPKNLGLAPHAAAAASNNLPSVTQQGAQPSSLLVPSFTGMIAYQLAASWHVHIHT